MCAMDNLTSLNVMNWNGRSLRNKAPELFDFMVLHRIDLAIVTETWLQSNMSFSHDSFSCIRLDRDPRVAQRGGGVMIVVRKGIPYERIDNLAVKCPCTHHSGILSWRFDKTADRTVPPRQT